MPSGQRPQLGGSPQRGLSPACGTAAPTHAARRIEARRYRELRAARASGSASGVLALKDAGAQRSQFQHPQSAVFDADRALPFERGQGLIDALA